MPEQFPSVVSCAASRAAMQGLAPPALWGAVLNARADLAHRRSLPGHLEPSVRVALVTALESYVESLAERGHPVPYALRDELRLQRSVRSDSRSDRPMTHT
jgi:hypothetical protein